MIDVESIVFTKVATSLRSEFSGIFVAGEEVAAPSTFPAVTIVEMDNSDYEESMDAPDAENHVRVMYQVDVYSNKTSGKKAECKKIIADVDKTIKGLGFVRIMKSPMPSSSSSIYRITARYRAVIGKDGENYLTYHK